MNSPYQSELVLDGLVCLFDGFDFFSSDISFVLPTYISVKVKSSKDFRGVLSLQDKKIGEVKFGYFNNLPISILITSTRVQEQISFTDVRKTICRGVDYAVNLLGDNSLTRHEWSRRHCDDYYDWIYKTICDDCKENSTDTRHLIFASDLQLFGQFFSEYLKTSFEEMNYGLFISICDFGQSLLYELAVNRLQDLNVARIHELVVHVAKDHWLPGKLLLWNRNAVRKYVGGGPMTDFFCCFTGQHGNFVFTDHQENDAIKHVKFYNDMFKQVHRGKRPPFRKVSVLSALLGNRTQDLNRILHDLDVVARFKDLAEARNYNCARVEAILSLNNDEERRKLRPLLRECRVIFEAEFGHAFRSLASFPFYEMKKQMRNTLTPALKTLKGIVRQEKRFRRVSPGHCAKIEPLHQAMACEMIISYFVYGKLDYWRGSGPRFNQEMRNILKLNGGTFRFAETFRGLGFTDGVTLIDGELRYTGQLLVTNFVTAGVTDEENQDRLSNCLEILESDGNSNGRLQEVYETIAEILWEEILVHAEKTRYKRPYSNVSEECICNIIARNPCHDLSNFISSKLFVEYLFRNENLEQLVVRRVLEAVRYFGGRVDLIQTELENRIEKEIYKNGKALLYPADDSVGSDVSNTKVVLPSTGAEDQKFSTVSQEVKIRIASQYQQSWHSIFGYFLPVGHTMDCLQTAENRIGESKVVENIFWEMMTRYFYYSNDPSRADTSAASGTLVTASTATVAAPTESDPE